MKTIFVHGFSARVYPFLYFISSNPTLRDSNYYHRESIESTRSQNQPPFFHSHTPFCLSTSAQVRLISNMIRSENISSDGVRAEARAALEEMSKIICNDMSYDAT